MGAAPQLPPPQPEGPVPSAAEHSGSRSHLRAAGGQSAPPRRRGDERGGRAGPGSGQWKALRSALPSSCASNAARRPSHFPREQPLGLPGKQIPLAGPGRPERSPVLRAGGAVAAGHASPQHPQGTELLSSPKNSGQGHGHGVTGRAWLHTRIPPAGAGPAAPPEAELPASRSPWPEPSRALPGRRGTAGAAPSQPGLWPPAAEHGEGPAGPPGPGWMRGRAGLWHRQHQGTHSPSPGALPEHRGQRDTAPATSELGIGPPLTTAWQAASGTQAWMQTSPGGSSLAMQLLPRPAGPVGAAAARGAARDQLSWDTRKSRPGQACPRAAPRLLSPAEVASQATARRMRARCSRRSQIPAAWVPRGRQDTSTLTQRSLEAQLLCSPLAGRNM